MFRPTVIAFVLVFCQSVVGQELITDSSTVLKSGIYKDFFELKYNCPSRVLNFSIDSIEKTDVLKSYSFLEMETMFYYQTDPKAENRKPYGFSDGKSVFIKVDLDKKNMPLYSKLSDIGRYAYVPYILQGELKTNMSNANAIGLYYEKTTQQPKILSLTTGNLYLLTPSILYQISDEDKKITGYLETDKNLENKLHHYFSLYSEQHKNDVQNFSKIELIKTYGLEEAFLCYNDSIDKSLSDYYRRIQQFEQSPIYISIDVDSTYYSDGSIKSVSIKAQHRLGETIEYRNKIGTWIDFHKNGQIKQIRDFNFVEQKNGRHQAFDKEGNISSDKLYKKGKVNKSK